MNTHEILPYPENMILLVEVGSTAHGTGIPGGEDHDETAVVVETPEQVFNLNRALDNRMERTQPEGSRSGPGDVDRQIYSLRSFLKLCTAGNPSIQLVLYAPLLESTRLGEELRDISPAFIGRHVVPRYRGYMKGQVMRMQGLKSSGHGRRGGGKREELIAQHGYDTKYAMHAARLGFQCIELLETNQLSLPIQGEPGDWLRAVRNGNVSYDDWFSRVNDLDTELGFLENDSRFREGPNLDVINTWAIKAHRTCWNY